MTQDPPTWVTALSLRLRSKAEGNVENLVHHACLNDLRSRRVHLEPFERRAGIREDVLVHQRRDVSPVETDLGVREMYEVAEAMSDYWVAFVTIGDPNGPPTAGKWPNWPRYSAATDALLEIRP